jgi:RimJ/RimL family protein N-acetyltransferase
MAFLAKRNPAPSAVTLTTERLRLRRLRVSDAPAMVCYLNDREVAREAADLHPDFDMAAARQRIDCDRGNWSGDREYMLAIERRLECDFIGCVCAMVQARHPGGRGEAELGYWIGRPFWGAGYASEAVSAAVGLFCQHFRLARLTAVVFSDNPASARVLAKCGFRLTCEEMRKSPARGGVHPVRIYALESEDITAQPRDVSK